MTTAVTTHFTPQATAAGRLIRRLRALTPALLARMYVPAEKLYVFRLRRIGADVIAEGRSRRYTAIVLLGLRTESEPDAATALQGDRPQDVARRLLEDAPRMTNLGDVALALWAAAAWELHGLQPAFDRLAQLDPAGAKHFNVELSWALAALSRDLRLPGVDALRAKVRARLLSAFNERSGLFPHVVAEGYHGLRAHVSCFADLVYAVQALALYAQYSDDSKAREVARRCAAAWSSLRGPDGQWWWHYDYRTGRIVERYPVYTVHQLAMGPMALFAAKDACGADFSAAIEHGLNWVTSPTELTGQSLVDDGQQLVWRKVARREPRKLARRMQALASGVHPALRVPGLDVVLPPAAVDYETRPYEYGWLLHAFTPERARRWIGSGR
ncbi:MAG: hypothetical protein AB7Q17_06575 [Phycisphaerae bacterium]